MLLYQSCILLHHVRAITKLIFWKLYKAVLWLLCILWGLTIILVLGVLVPFYVIDIYFVLLAELQSWSFLVSLRTLDHCISNDFAQETPRQISFFWEVYTLSESTPDWGVEGLDAGKYILDTILVISVYKREISPWRIRFYQLYYCNSTTYVCYVMGIK